MCSAILPNGVRSKVKLIRNISEDLTFLFIDPPFHEKGRARTLNTLKPRYYEQLSRVLRERPQLPWVLTYENCPEIRRLNRGWSMMGNFSVRYTARDDRPGSEFLIVPKWKGLLTHQASVARTW
jgi:DNA adenine methylase